jgi:hypothetical protein
MCLDKSNSASSQQVQNKNDKKKFPLSVLVRGARFADFNYILLLLLLYYYYYCYYCYTYNYYTPPAEFVLILNLW